MTDDCKHYYFDRDGEAMEESAWRRLQADEGYRLIGMETFGGLVVETDWAGVVSHRDRAGRPLIFETTIFRRGEYDVIRYASLAEAKAGHRAAVAVVMAVSEGRLTVDPGGDHDR